jgi:hypothetical protein
VSGKAIIVVLIGAVLLLACWKLRGRSKEEEAKSRFRRWVPAK